MRRGPSHRHSFIPTSRDIWTIVETPLAGARGYQKSKTQRTWVLRGKFHSLTLAATPEKWRDAHSLNADEISPRFTEFSGSYQRPLNFGVFGKRELQRVDESPLAGTRGYPAHHSLKLLGDCYQNVPLRPKLQSEPYSTRVRKRATAGVLGPKTFTSSGASATLRMLA